MDRINRVQSHTETNFVFSKGNCDLDSIKSARIRFACTNLWVRMPYVFPFSDGKYRNEFPGQYYMAKDVDWIWLGIEVDAMEEYLSDFIAEYRPEAIEVVFFEEFTGSLQQIDCDSDQVVTIPRRILNYNLAQWESACADMLHAEEKEWHRFATNTCDQQPYLQPILDKIAVAEPKLILDMGCGVGQTARSLALRYRNSKVVGFDSSQAAIEVARHHFRLDNLEFRVGGIGGKLPFHDRSADLVVALNALMYGENQLSTASEFFRVLSRDGLLMHNSRMLDSHMIWDFPVSLAGPTVFQLNAPDWIEAARNRGFNTMIKVLPAFLSPFPGFYLPSASDQFKEAYVESLGRDITSSSMVYNQWYSHALMMHARNIKMDVRGLTDTNYIRRLDSAVNAALESKRQFVDAMILGSNYSFASLKLCPEGTDFIARCLPKSGLKMAAVLLGQDGEGL